MPTSTTPADHYAPPNLSAAGRAWRWLALAAVLGMIFLNYYANTRPFNGQTMGYVSAKYPTWLTPAGHAFAIWGLIFLSLVAYAGWQLLPAPRRLSFPDAVARPLVMACAAASAWVVLFAHEMILPSVGVMFLLLCCLVVAYGRARRRIFADAAPSWVGVPFSLFLGWISVASVINFTLGLRHLGWQPSEGLSVVLTLSLYAVVVGLGLIISRVFRDMVFPLVVAWALAWVWVARMREVPELAWAALAGSVVVAVFGVVLARKGGRKTPWQLRDEAAAAAEADIAARKSVGAGR